VLVGAVVADAVVDAVEVVGTDVVGALDVQLDVGQRVGLVVVQDQRDGLAESVWAGAVAAELEALS
jgi:hypothetical protein